jgi:enamine deaminase RidA (YjgF/YER057c/UK114 family)
MKGLCYPQGLFFNADGGIFIQTFQTLYLMKAIEHINPEGMYKSPAFSQAVVTQGTGKTIYIGGQNGVDANGKMIGTDIATQTTQAMKNIETLLQTCGADWNNVVRFTIIMKQEEDLMAGFKASQAFTSKAAQQAAVTAMVVAGLAHPEGVVEIDAIAFLPDEKG